MKILTREGTLKELEEVGKKIALSANPQHYSHEDRGRAKNHIKPLEECRKAYKAIRDGSNIKLALRTLIHHVHGIEENRLRLILKASTTGFNKDHNWEVKNNQITFVSSLN